MIIGEGKQQFLEYVAKDFDDMVAKGIAPLAMVYCFVAPKGETHTNWLCIGDAEDRMELYTSRGLMCLSNDLHAAERANIDHE